MKTLFIETDHKFDIGHMKTLSNLFDKDYTTYDKIELSAANRGQEVLESVQEADEIFVDSSLTYNPMGDGSILFNQLMFKAIELDIKGKKIHFFRELNDVNWFRLKKDFVKKVFAQNELFVEHCDEKTYAYTWEKVDIEKLLT